MGRDPTRGCKVLGTRKTVGHAHVSPDVTMRAMEDPDEFGSPRTVEGYGFSHEAHIGR